MNKLAPTAWITGLALLMPTTSLAAENGVKGDPMSPIVLEMIWAVVLFLIFASILGFVVWPKVLGALQAREQKLEGDLVGAETARKQAEAALAEYKAKIAEAQAEARKVVEQAKTAAERTAATIKSETEAEIAKLRDRASAEIAAAKEQAVSEIHAQTAELATLVAGKILRREINAADQQRLVQESLAELTGAGA